MTDERAAARQAAVDQAVADVRALETQHGVTRAGLELIARKLVELTGQHELFGEAEFPNPPPGAPARLYLLSEDDGGRFPLYLTCALPGGTVRPHNHNTWAVVAGLSGCEENTFYRRVEGGEEPGPATIEVDRTSEVRTGESVALMPEDIHSVATLGGVPRRHFHMYGLSLERLSDRLAYDTEAGRCDYMEINPKIVKPGD